MIIRQYFAECVIVLVYNRGQLTHIFFYILYILCDHFTAVIEINLFQ